MRLPWRERRGHHDARRPDLAFDVAVLAQPPVHQVLVVGHGDVERDRQPPHPAHLGADSWSTCFHSTALSSSWMQMALVIVYGSPLLLCKTVQVADLAETVTAELQR